MRSVWRLLGRALIWGAALILLGAVILTVQGHGLASRHEGGEFQPLRMLPDSSLIRRGRHLSEIRCAGCHAPDAEHPDELSGGSQNQLATADGRNLGVLVAPDLTPAGSLGHASDLEVARAIREGISVRGGPLLVMPSPSYRLISDRDLAALIAYLRSQPSVASEAPERRLNLLAYLLLGLHQFEDSVVPPVIVPTPDPPADSAIAIGRYLTMYLGCRECHGPALHGGIRGQIAPLADDLVAFAAAHDSTTFERALRRGERSAGGTMNPGRMPWPSYAHLSDSELGAVYAFIHSLGPASR